MKASENNPGHGVHKSIMTTGKYLTTKWNDEDHGAAQTNMWISHNYPFLRGMYYHIANETPGEMKGGGHMWRIKQAAMGVLPGVPDFRFEQVEVPYNDNHTFPNDVFIRVAFRNGTDTTVHWFDGWYLELKMPGKTPSTPQRQLHERWRSHGIRVEWTDSPAGVVELITATYGKPIY